MQKNLEKINIPLVFGYLDSIFSNISGLFRSWSEVKWLYTNKLIVFIFANFIPNMIDSSSLKVNKSTLNINLT